MIPRGILVRILDLARWAPSADNVQTWRFEIRDPNLVAVHCKDTRDHCVYDLGGHPSQLGFGALLETMAIAASGHGLRTHVDRDGSDTAPVFRVRFEHDSNITRSPLADSITKRATQRRAMRTRPLSDEEKRRMEIAVGNGYTIQWLESFWARLRLARLLYHYAKLRLTMPEAFDVHRAVIEWNARYSTDKMPDQSLGVDPITTRFMRWAMKSWDRLKVVNTIVGTALPRLQMDLIPGVACAAHYVIKARKEPRTIDDHVAAGRAVQRFWLTLTSLGLAMQPELTPLVFASYVRRGWRFTCALEIEARARTLEAELHDLVDTGGNVPVFMGRVGDGPAPRARALRRSLEELMM